MSGCERESIDSASLLPTPTPPAAPPSPLGASPGRTLDPGPTVTAPAQPARALPPASFYDVAEGQLNGMPGSLIDSLELTAPSGVRVWAVLYRSTGMDGSLVPVSGLILAPADTAGPGTGASGRPVLAWGHGTTGLADACAPSREGAGGVGFEPLVALARQGYVVAATDYEGLGTAGIHPYLVGVSEGRSILDAIRAAQSLPEAGAGSSAAIVGISQGGHAALWAAEILDAYAPELDVVGAVAASPPIDLRRVQRAVLGRGDVGEAAWMESLMVAAAWREVYDSPLDDLLTNEATRIVRALADECPWSIPGPTRSPFRVDPGSIPEWQALLEANSPGAQPAGTPILVLAATEDDLVPASTIQPGVDRLCAAGSSVELRWVEGPHAATLADPIAAAGALAWILDRFRGQVSTADCG